MVHVPWNIQLKCYVSLIPVSLPVIANINLGAIMYFVITLSLFRGIFLGFLLSLWWPFLSGEAVSHFITKPNVNLGLYFSNSYYGYLFIPSTRKRFIGGTYSAKEKRNSAWWCFDWVDSSKATWVSTILPENYLLRRQLTRYYYYVNSAFVRFNELFVTEVESDLTSKTQTYKTFQNTLIDHHSEALEQHGNSRRRTFEKMPLDSRQLALVEDRTG